MSKVPFKSGASVIWLTGLSGAGKSTIATLIEKKLLARGHRVEMLDGDAIRNIFPSTGFSVQERNDHVKRVGFVASRLEAHGVTVLASLISPFEGSRQFVRGLCKNYFEVYLSTPLDICESRDPKGLYKKARAGEIKSFTGIDSAYEIPTAPELSIDTSSITAEEAANLIITKAFSAQMQSFIEAGR
ncbi:MAG: adenylyl-sulfate kinase [Pseudobdellovibrionaceae bacterium]